MSEGNDWSDLENGLIIADYFAMLELELSGKPFNKAARNRAMQETIHRSRGSIEFKHQNISAVLQSFGEAWIEGYKPRYNFQMPLADAVDRWLRDHHLEPLAEAETNAHRGLFDPAQLFIGPAPTFSNTTPPGDLEKSLAVARKFDIAQRDEQNRQLGRAGEELVFDRERAHLNAAGRQDLSNRVEWTSQVKGDGAGYDIASFNPDGSLRLIEVKTTNGWDRTPFHISANEIAVANERRKEWCLLRLWNFRREPRAFEIYPPLEAHVRLTPTSFQASIQ